MGIHIYNIIWANGNNTKIKTNKQCSASSLKNAFESMSNVKVADVQEIIELESYIVEESEKKNLSFSYTFYEAGLPFYYNRNFIPDVKYAFNSELFLQNMKALKNEIWGSEAVINNASMTR